MENGKWKMNVRRTAPILNNRAMRDTTILNSPFSIINLCRGVNYETLRITIARQYGSGGKTVGKMLADKLGIPFYNREIITMASEDSGVNAMLFSDERLKGDFLTRLRAHYHGNAPVPNDSSKSYLKDEALFAYQMKIIRRLADQGPCVMIGRCADYILAGRPDVVRVFVHADKDSVSSRP